MSRGLLFRFQEDVLDLNPKAVVMLIGINDLTARQPASATLENVRSMLALRNEQHAKVPVFLCTVPPSAQPKAPVDEQQRLALNQGLRQIAKETKAPKFKIRLRNRCRLCGRPRGYLRKFAMCRLCFRKLALEGDITGVTKSSW